MPAWEFASFDGNPLVFTDAGGLVFEDGAWREPFDNSWVMEAKVLSSKEFAAKFGAIELPPIRDWRIAADQAGGTAAQQPKPRQTFSSAAALAMGRAAKLAGQKQKDASLAKAGKDLEGRAIAAIKAAKNSLA